VSDSRFRRSSPWPDSIIHPISLAKLPCVVSRTPFNPLVFLYRFLGAEFMVIVVRVATTLRVLQCFANETAVAGFVFRPSAGNK
jgi:hypothetical protein